MNLSRLSLIFYDRGGTCGTWIYSHDIEYDNNHNIEWRTSEWIHLFTQEAMDSWASEAPYAKS